MADRQARDESTADGERGALMRQHLEALAGRDGLSRDLYEVVTKSLA